MSKLTNPSHPKNETTLLVDLSQLPWHPRLKRIPLMEDIAQVQPRKATQNANEADDANAEDLQEFTDNVALSHAAFTHSVKRGLVEKIIVAQGSDGVIYLIDGRDRVAALKLSGQKSTLARLIPWEDADHTIRAQLLRKPSTQFSRAFAAAEEYPQWLGRTAGNPELTLSKEQKKLPLSVQAAIPLHEELEKMQAEKGPQNRQQLAAVVGVSLPTIDRAYEILKLVLDREKWEELNPEEASEEGYKSADFWVKRIFSGYSIGGVRKGLKNSEPEKETSPNHGKATVGFSLGRLKAGIGSWGQQGKLWAEVPPDKLTELEQHAKQAIAATPKSYRDWWAKLMVETELPVAKSSKSK